MKIVFAPPEGSGASAEERLRALYSYLTRMSNDLNVALSAIDTTNMSPETVQMIQSGGTAVAESQSNLAEQASVLKSLIVKTADAVYSKMDEMKINLKGEYLALSAWGTEKTALESLISTTADGITQDYTHLDEITNGKVNDNAVAFDEYKKDTKAFIRTGLIYYDDNDDPVYGVAIGQFMDTTIQHGQEVVVLTGDKFVTTYTAQRLSFWQNGQELAYVANNEFHAPRMVVDNTMSIGGYVVETANGLAFRWKGGS